jgi:hypothetical protein
MIAVAQEIFEKTLARLSEQLTTYLPPLLVAVAILSLAYVLARCARWLIAKAFKGIALDRFLRESGVSSLLDPAGHLRGTAVAAAAIYWLILLTGFLAALDVFDTKLSSQIIEATVFLLPKLLTAGLLLLAGFWLAQYLGRSVLVWSVNEGIPHSRKLAGGVRMAVAFVAVVVAADVLNFARDVFLAAFVIFAGGAVLAASLALGLGGRDAVRRQLHGREHLSEETPEKSAWSHL